MPAKSEKMDMAQSIVDVFPVLKDSSGSYVSRHFFAFLSVLLCFTEHFIRVLGLPAYQLNIVFDAIIPSRII